GRPARPAGSQPDCPQRWVVQRPWPAPTGRLGCCSSTAPLCCDDTASIEILLTAAGESLQFVHPVYAVKQAQSACSWNEAPRRQQKCPQPVNMPVSCPSNDRGGPGGD